MSKQTAVEFLAKKYNYITWLINKDEMSAQKADEMRAKFLKEAKEMEKQQIIDAYQISMMTAEQYYNETYNPS